MRAISILLLLTACGSDQFTSKPQPDGGDPLDSSSAPDVIGAEAGVGEGGVPVAFCKAITPAPAFCMDFDQNSLTMAYESGVLTAINPPVASSMLVELDTANPQSPPAALATGSSLVIATDSKGRYEAPVTLAAPNEVTRLRFAFRLDTFEPVPNGPLVRATLGEIAVHTPQGDVVAQILLASSQPLLGVSVIGPSISSGTKISDSTVVLPKHKWVILELVLHLSNQQTPSIAELFVDTISAATALTKAGTLSSTGADLSFGLAVPAPYGVIQTEYDNVTFAR